MKKVILIVLFMAFVMTMYAKKPKYVLTPWDQRIPDQEWFKIEFAGHDYISYDHGAVYIMISLAVIKNTDGYEVIVLDGFYNKIYRCEVADCSILDWAFSDMVAEFNDSERVLRSRWINDTIKDVSYVNSEGETLAAIDINRYHFASEDVDDKLFKLLNYLGDILNEDYRKDHPELCE